MLKFHLPLLCLLALCCISLPLQAKTILVNHNNRVEILQLPGRIISDLEAEELDKQLTRMIKSHNSDPGPSRSNYNGVDEKRECIDLLGYGAIGNGKAKKIHESLRKMIKDHNRRLKKAQPTLVPDNSKQLQQQQFQQQQQLMMQQQQQIQLQQQQLWMQQQREQQLRLQKQQQEQQLQQQQQMEQQRRDQEKLQQEREKEQNRIQRVVRGTQKS